MKFDGLVLDSSRQMERRLYYSGSLEDDINHRHGVAILVSQRLVKYVANFVPISECCMLLHLKGHSKNINLIQIYAPTLDKRKKRSKNFTNRKPNKRANGQDINIVMGDLNVKIGRGQVDKIVGPHSLGQRNKRGDRSLQFCQEKELIIMNTWFQLSPRRLYTWRSPLDNVQNNARIRNQIDYITNRRFRNSVKSVKTYPGADINLDHNPVVAEIRLRLKVQRQKQIVKRINIKSLKNPKIRDNCSGTLNKKIAELNACSELNMKETWKQLKKNTQGNSKGTDRIRDK